MNVESFFPRFSTAVILFVAYIGSAFLFASFSPQSQIVSFWPPAGIALAGVLLLGWRFIPFIILGSFTFNSMIQWSPSTDLVPFTIIGLLIACSSAFQALINAKVLEMLKIDILDAPSVKCCVIFIAVTFISCLFSALVGNTVLNVATQPNNVFDLPWHNVSVWWLGDFIGAITLCPIVLSLLVKRTQYDLIKSITLPMIFLVITIQLFQQYVEQEVADDTVVDFNTKAKVVENNLRNNINHYVNTLNTLANQISLDPQLTSKEFSEKALSLIEQNSGIKALSWNPLIHQRYLDAFIEKNQKTFPGFNVKGAPLLSTDPLVVVQYIEPLSENLAAQGFNVYSNQSRKNAMIQAQISHSAVATDIITLVQSKQKEPGFLLLKPIYGDESADVYSLDRPQSIAGFAVGVFLVNEIIEQSTTNQLMDDISLYIYENGDHNKPVYGDDSLARLMDDQQGYFHRFELTFANHHWSFILHIAPDSYVSKQVALLLNFLIFSIIIGAFSVLLVLTTFGRHQSMRREVTARTKQLHQLNMQLEHFAFYDALTELPNRRLFIDRVSQAIKIAKRNHSKFAILFLDLNKFKQVNDNLGHEVGDQLLVEVAKRFASALRKSDTLARFGGDEFTVLLEEVEDLSIVTEIAHKLAVSLTDQFEIEQHSLVASTSIGIAMYPENGQEIQALLSAADIAMYQSKQGNKAFSFYQ
ncbi:diguanylate cyclase domain-containing protein [Psychrobium sp. 1_MG-2023]|uniref:diguanylate cyclase domain-containing protein n=1 Tax=Psychrobium sp. 1_MG-2023 TaxID=3062624 RepID=UPI000C348218|nr:diguanylate cyclase [Psychrobium sp. 1_MG-2023]MDP2560346.1 diguanylate cyclase [Psychrobium sp. 1_MG-2023]PKF55456.1 hypothetical protein CW748_13250 [Alteromonadales bacterium alter-6D02]